MRWRLKGEQTPVKNGPDLDGSSVLDGDFSMHPEVVTPEEFVLSQSGLLEESQNKWRSTTDLLQGFKDDKIREDIQSGVRNFYAKQPASPGESTDTEVVRSVGDALLDDLSVMWLVQARHMSGQRNSFTDNVKESNTYLYGVPNPIVRNIVVGLPMMTKGRITKNFQYASLDMGSADIVGYKVLKRFVDSFGEDPGRVSEFVDMYRDGVADIDPHFAEFRKIIATDWNHPDPNKSVLRNHLQGYSTDPLRHLDAFAAEVATNRSDHALGRLRAMAGFAIIASGVDTVTEAGIKQKITSTHGRWADIPAEDIDGLFSKFMTSRAKGLEAAIAAIAGRQDPQDIRVHRLYDDVYRYFETIHLHAPQTRQERRSSRRTHNAMTGAHNMPSAKSLAAEAESLRRKPVERDLVLLQTQQHGQGRRVPISAEDLADKFKLPVEGNILRDMQTVVQHLRNVDRVTMRGIKRINTTVRLGGGEVKMWRFAPNDCPGVRVDSNNRFWRVVFAMQGNELLLLDILDHPTFDQRY